MYEILPFINEKKGGDGQNYLKIHKKNFLLYYSEQNKMLLWCNF